MRPFLVIVFLTLLLDPVRSETFGDWNTGYGQGVAEYWIEKANGDKLMIDCGEPPYGPSVDVRIRSGADDFNDGKENSSITFRVGNREGSLISDKDGRLNTSCTACISNYELFWQVLRSGAAIEFERPDGRQVEFLLRGSTKAFPEKQCVSQVELEMLSAQNSAKKLAKPSVAKSAGSPDLAEKTSGSCAIEDWKYAEKANNIYLNGTTTCPSGKLIYRLYDGQSGAFIGSNVTFIEGYAFQSYTDGVTPKSVRIKYVIEEP
jgi:hypothetical protein